jgi:hypothetical protein
MPKTTSTWRAGDADAQMRLENSGGRPAAVKSNRQSGRVPRADATRARRGAGRGQTSSRPSPILRPVERAQLVWRRALELSGHGARHDRFALALDLLRAAHHDPATMAHALALGRRHLLAEEVDPSARGAASALEEAIAFLGVKPHDDEVARRADDDAGPPTP